MAPWAIVPDVAAIVRMPPRMRPMHGVQPMAKIAPSPNDASQPPFDDDEPAAQAVGGTRSSRCSLERRARPSP